MVLYTSPCRLPNLFFPTLVYNTSEKLTRIGTWGNKSCMLAFKLTYQHTVSGGMLNDNRTVGNIANLQLGPKSPFKVLNLIW